MQSYRSLGPNHAHQLMVAPSKHYYLGQDGLLKYQQKPFALELADMPQAQRQHLVIYTLRDHCSTVLYAEVCFAPALMPLRVFLARAWGAKPYTPFRGFPELLITSRKVAEVFTDDLAAVAALGVSVSQATSGFQSGIRCLGGLHQRGRGAGYGARCPCPWAAGKDAGAHSVRAGRASAGLGGSACRVTSSHSQSASPNWACRARSARLNTARGPWPRRAAACNNGSICCAALTISRVIFESLEKAARGGL